MTKPGGKFVISLDFELNWGVRDVQSLEEYGANILGVRKVVPALLNIFNEFGIKATWSTVGLLFFEDKAELMKALPNIKPQYINPKLSPYPSIQEIGQNEQQDPYHFGLSLIGQIKEYPDQEIGTHTFSHYYCLERGQTIESFKADLQAAVSTAQRSGVTLTSLVFPRNQCNPSYLSACAQLGIICFRGNERSWIYKELNEEQQSHYKRGIRLVDAYLNLSGHNCHAMYDLGKSYPINIPASRFLRPYSKRFAFLEEIRLKRILSGLTHAAKQGQIYHLWWHPHNFGVNLKENLDFLRRILEHYSFLQKEYDMESCTMSEVANSIINQLNNE